MTWSFLRMLVWYYQIRIRFKLASPPNEGNDHVHVLWHMLTLVWASRKNYHFFTVNSGREGCFRSPFLAGILLSRIRQNSLAFLLSLRQRTYITFVLSISYVSSLSRELRFTNMYNEWCSVTGLWSFYRCITSIVFPLCYQPSKDLNVFFKFGLCDHFVYTTVLSSLLHCLLSHNIKNIKASCVGSF